MNLDSLAREFARRVFRGRLIRRRLPKSVGGAARLLADVRPTLIVEVDSRNWDGARHILEDAGYRLHDPDHPDRAIRGPLLNVLARPD